NKAIAFPSLQFAKVLKSPRFANEDRNGVLKIGGHQIRTSIAIQVGNRQPERTKSGAEWKPRSKSAVTVAFVERNCLSPAHLVIANCQFVHTIEIEVGNY